MIRSPLQDVVLPLMNHFVRQRAHDLLLAILAPLGDLFEQVVEQFPSLGGFVLSGGETAGRLLAGCGVRSLRMLGEVMPLIALSQIEDGRLAGRYLVTKGGTVGTTSAIADALGRLYDVIADGPPGVAARSRTGQRGDVLVPG